MKNIYHKSVIYKLSCLDPLINDFYIGSTTNYYVRKRVHKSNCKNPLLKAYKFKLYTFIRENGGFDNWKFTVLDNIKCNSRLELNKIERGYYDRLKPTLNHSRPSITAEEETQMKKEFNYHYKRNEVKCICGSLIKERNFKVHLSRIKHIDTIELLKCELLDSIGKR